MSAHGHSHGATGSGRRLQVAFGITLAILVLEVLGSLLTGSLALLVDAAHMATDAGGLGLAVFASGLMSRPATSRRTWGFVRAEVLSATAQAAVLLGVGLFVLVEGIGRLVEPPAIPSGPLVLFGVLGLVGNVVSALVLAGGRRGSVSVRAAFLEVVNDALGSAAVIVAAVVIATTGWTRADPIAAILIGALILPRAFVLLRETLDVLLESTPRGLDLDSVRDHLLRLPHVREVHDLHASQMSTALPVLTAHVVLETECFYDGHAPAMLDELQACVSEHFAVQVDHSTFQLEPAAHADHEAKLHS